MKVGNIKSGRAFSGSNDKTLGVISYGENNDFPQKVMQIVGASGTGTGCLTIYSDFLVGKGIEDADLAKMIVNEDGDTLNNVAKMLAIDNARFNGFAIHYNYNALGQIVSISHIPFEQVRLGLLDPTKDSYNKLLVHTDWAREFVNVQKFSKDDIVMYDVFDPNIEVIEAQVAAVGDWDNYNGQIYYYSEEGKMVYPTPLYEARLTDMRTEEGLSNITMRNTTNNFLPAGALVDVVQQESEQGNDEVEQQLRAFQGDENALKLLYLQVGSKDEVPEFINMEGNNYDKSFSQTQEVVPNNIGLVFMQPAELRGADKGGGFESNKIRNAYDYYNSRTYKMRSLVADTLNEVLPLLANGVGDKVVKILPLSYVTREDILTTHGPEATIKIEELLNGSLSTEDKKIRLRLLYGLSDDIINQLITS